jgi:hypothetical protein
MEVAVEFFQLDLVLHFLRTVYYLTRGEVVTLAQDAGVLVAASLLNARSVAGPIRNKDCGSTNYRNRHTPDCMAC